MGARLVRRNTFQTNGTLAIIEIGSNFQLTGRILSSALHGNGTFHVRLERAEKLLVCLFVPPLISMACSSQRVIFRSSLALFKLCCKYLQ